MTDNPTDTDQEDEDVITFPTQLLRNFNSVASQVVALVASDEMTVIGTGTRRKPQGRCLRSGVLHSIEDSLWRHIDRHSDEKEFLHFSSFSRDSFDLLVEICQEKISCTPLDARYKASKEYKISSRRHTPRDIVAVGIKYLISCAEHKDIFVQFGMTQTMYLNCLRVALTIFVDVLEFNEKSRVWWNKTPQALKRTAEMTASFIEIPNVVAMIDGQKLPSACPADPADQNADYNGWTKETNRNVILLWNPDGTIIDAVINAPGSFHDSKTTKWGGIYDHISSLPHPYIVVCDDAFVTSGELHGKLMKTTYDEFGSGEKSEHDKSLTHLRQCSEWGNNDWTKVFRRLKMKLPTDNVTRARLLWCCVFLHNYRVNTIGRSQIKSYFNYINDLDLSHNNNNNNNNK